MQRSQIGRGLRPHPAKQDKPKPAATTDTKMKSSSVKSADGAAASQKEKTSPAKRPATSSTTKRKPGAMPMSTRRKDRGPKDMAKAAKCLELEHRIIIATFCLGVFSSLLFLTAVAADHWVIVAFEIPIFKNDTDRNVAFYRTGYNHGLWRVCEYEYYNNTLNFPDQLYCSGLILFSSDPNIDPVTMHYRRSCCAIGILALVVSVFAHVGSWYSVKSLRYIYKRLAGILHLITGACCWITVEVFKRSLEYEQSNYAVKLNVQLNPSYGFCYYFGYICFTFFLITGIVLLVCSRKRKGERARSVREAAENEPVNIGRI